MPAYPLPPISSFAANAFKVVALALMLSDHVHYVFFNRQLEWLYWLSRLVFPIFALIAAQNLEHHRANPKRYISRLLLYGVIAQPFYYWSFGFAQFNVLFTLAVSVGAWWWSTSATTARCWRAVSPRGPGSWSKAARNCSPARRDSRSERRRAARISGLTRPSGPEYTPPAPR